MISHKPPRRIVIIRPCCMGDVVLATPVLCALRRAHPDAHITFAVGTWSQQVIAHHPAVDAWLDTGPAAMPVKSGRGLWRMVRQLRLGRFDWVISLVRSPLMSAAVGLSGIAVRAGMNSNGRGFGYNHRLPVDPAQAQHEADLYLGVVRLLHIDTRGCYANLPVPETAEASVRRLLHERGISAPFIVVNPAGGANPGMVMSSKRWPPPDFAQVSAALARAYGFQIVLLGGPDDGAIVQSVVDHLPVPSVAFVGALSFPQIGALAAQAALYIGNDTGLTHVAAASGAKTVMILGPSDPKRYAPYTPDSLALWKPAAIKAGGVARAAHTAWDWERDGVSPQDALQRIEQFLTT